MNLAKELGLTDKGINVIIYGDISLGMDGYSHKYKEEIGLNLENNTDLNKEKIKNAEEIRGTTAHELAHQIDKTNTNTADREALQVQ